jgi:hypothetical protein
MPNHGLSLREQVALEPVGLASRKTTAWCRHGGSAHQFVRNLSMKFNTTTILLAVALIAIGAAGFWIYQEQTRSGVEVNVGGRTMSLETR